MTREEMKMMQPAQEYIRKLQKKRNAGTENCMLSSELANLHHFLIDVGFLFRERTTYELKLSKDYAGLGYAMTRSHFRYDKRGDLVETRFPVWTEKGQEFIKNLITGNRHKEKARNLKTTKAI